LGRKVKKKLFPKEGGDKIFAARGKIAGLQNFEEDNLTEGRTPR